MAKLTLDTITSSFASTTLFNTNFATILAELDGKVLYRNNTSGEANQMENDLDMNSNSILNADTVNTTSLIVNGTPVTASTAISTAASAVTYDDSASVHTATTVQETLDELGTASLATAQTSATDTTVGALMAVGAFGLGLTTDLDAANIDTLTETQTKRFGSGTVGRPSFMSFGIVSHISRNANDATQIAQQVVGEGLASRSKTAGVWSSWQPVYTGANLNPNVFGDGTVGVVADGYANSTSIAVFTANIMSNTAPTSISVTGSFSVYTATDVLIASGVVPVLGSIKSNRVAPFVVTGLTGLTAKENLTLRPDTTSSKITVNF